MTASNNSANNDYKDFFLRYREAQIKFDYYFLGISLAFIMVAFQTYQRGNDISYDYLLLLSWITMLISSFSGIFRIRNIYVLQGVEAEHIKYIQNAQQEEKKETFFTKAINKMQKRLVVFGTIQIYLFFFAFIFYLMYQITKMYPDLFKILKWSP